MKAVNTQLSGILLALCLFATMAAVYAATDGEAGETSAGDIRIALSILPTIEINTVNEIHLNITNRSVDARYAEPFCVIGNASGRYRVTAYGSESRGDTFLLRNAEGEQLPYQVAFRGNVQGDQYDALSPGMESPTYNVFSSESACGEQTAFRITFLSSDLQAAGSGLYSGHLTLVVSPE